MTTMSKVFSVDMSEYIVCGAERSVALSVHADDVPTRAEQQSVHADDAQVAHRARHGACDPTQRKRGLGYTGLPTVTVRVT